MRSSKPGGSGNHRDPPMNFAHSAPGNGFGNSNPRHPLGPNRSGRSFGNPPSGRGSSSGGFGFRARPANRNYSKSNAGPAHSVVPRVPSPEEKELTAKFTKLLETNLAADGGCYTDDDEVSVADSKEEMLDKYKNRHGTNTSQSLESYFAIPPAPIFKNSANSHGIREKKERPQTGKPSNERAPEKPSHSKCSTKRNDKKKQVRNHQLSTSSSGHNGVLSSPTAAPEVPHRRRTNSRQKSVSESKPVSASAATHAKTTSGGETPIDSQTSAQLTTADFLREGGPPAGDTPDMVKMVAAVLQSDGMRNVLKKRNPELYDKMIKYVMDSAAQSLKI